MKQDYLSHVDYQYLAAEEATCGVLVNQLGKVDQIDGYTLFTGSTARVYKYASEELLSFWVEQQPRLTQRQFEEQWIQGRVEYQ